MERRLIRPEVVRLAYVLPVIGACVSSGCGGDPAGVTSATQDAAGPSSGLPGETGTATGPEATGPEEMAPTTSGAPETTGTPEPSGTATTAMPAPRCGDGQVDDGEECDDGDLSDEDDCLADCTHARCGDGFVWQGVEECDDGNADDHDACTSLCAAAYCGDGVVQAGVEDCDPEGVNTATCDVDCTPPECGDGLANHAAGEECDDGNEEYADNCYPTCKAPTMTIFVTSVEYTGDLGGVEGADAKCEALAAAANVAGTFKALLSTSTGRPEERIVQSPGRYVLRNKVEVAKSFSQIITGELLAPINVDENGEGAGLWPSAWTGHIAPQYPRPYDDPHWTCQDWTSLNASGILSLLHVPFLSDAEGYTLAHACDSTHRLICVQEPWYGPYPAPR